MNKKLFGILLFLLMIAGTLINAQGVYIETINGDEISQQMEDIDKGTFDGINLVFDMNNNTTITYNLLEVQKMYFYNNTVINDEITDESLISVYPNPTTGQISIENDNTTDTKVFIFSIQGRLILSGTVSAGSNTLDLSGNPPGIYLIKTANSTQKLILQ